MVNVDDIHGVGSWYSSAMRRLKEAGSNNQELILQFLSRLQKQGATLNTRADRLNLLIRMDKYFKKPLNEIAEKDFDLF